jgi:hypothetical protein
MMLANSTGRRCLCVHTYFDRLKFLNSEFSPMKQTTSRSDRNANVPAALAQQHMVEQYTAEQNLAEQNLAGQRDALLDKQKPVAR